MLDGLAEIRLKGDREAIERIVAAQQQETIDLALTAARERLGMEAAYVTSVTPTVQRFDVLSGDAEAIGIPVGAEVPIEATYCNRMLNGRIPNVVPDTSREPGVSDLPATKRIGSYVGVPIELSGGRIHGTLCAGSGGPREDLGDEELRFMRVLAGIVAERLEHAEQQLT